MQAKWFCTIMFAKSSIDSNTSNTYVPNDATYVPNPRKCAVYCTSEGKIPKYSLNRAVK
jgi:hypothetical protein